MIVLILDEEGQAIVACPNVSIAVESFKKSCSYPEFVECQDVQCETGFPHIEVYESGRYVGLISGVKLINSPREINIDF